jgi:hypothetical protein
MPLEAFHLGLLHHVVYYMLENLQIKRLYYYICGWDYSLSVIKPSNQSKYILS